MKPHSQRGVALIITLIMLAVVTLMAITFLAVSRRERSAVAVTEEQNTSRLMADAALARAQAEVVARMQANSSPYAYDLMVSTNYTSPVGFNPSLDWQQLTPTNVNYDHLLGNSAPVTGRDRLRNIANLILDPRAPVFVSDGTNVDFRFYLDLNRNGRFETNGLQPILDENGRTIRAGTGTNVLREHLVGDPEWIGVLQHPDFPHSATNRFVGRYAFMVLPAGKSLDLNFIHNNAAARGGDTAMANSRFFRNQGVGSWELNLGGFLHHLNTNAWPNYDYRGLASPQSGACFLTALDFLRRRYGGNYNTLAPARDWFIWNQVSMANVLRNDYIDMYADGPAFTGTEPLTTDNDDPTLPWPGSESASTYYEINDLFSTNKAPSRWLAGIVLAQAQPSTYNRYTLYRMLGQMGMDSVAPTDRKINLNYNNLTPYHATNLVSWEPHDFFTNVANRLIQAHRTMRSVRVSSGAVYNNTYIGEYLVRPGMSVTNIRIHPFNEYSPALHRLLQLTLNLYDATDQKNLTGPSANRPHHPTVMRPLFGLDQDGSSIIIRDYVEVTNAAVVNSLRTYDLSSAADRARLVNDPYAVVYDVPFVIGARKGWPNFNEIAMLNVAQLTRKTEVRKRALLELPSQTNLLYFLTVSNKVGLEAWNSYTQSVNRALQVIVKGNFSIAVTNLDSAVPLNGVFGDLPYNTNFALTAWPSNQFVLPVSQSLVVLSNVMYHPQTGQFIPAGTDLNFIPNQGFYMPQLALEFTNRFFYALVDQSVTPNRLVDFVCLGKMKGVMDLSREIAGRAQLASVAGSASEPPNTWLTNRIGGSTDLLAPTLGVQNQIDISLGNITTSAQQWRSWSAVSAEGRDKERSIDRLRLFCGLTPLTYTSQRERDRLAQEIAGKLAIQAGYSPTRKVYQEITWQANDPLVHYTLGDLLDPFNPPNDPNRTNAVRFAIPPQITLTNSNLGLLNQRYRPWGGNPNESADVLARDIRVKDPLIERSDDWAFPTNKLPNVGWIGRVHRGTPWQTIYLKADIADTNTTTQTSWYRWAGSQGTHPTNDWILADLFTTAPTDNAQRGLLSVNQDNLAAWAAVLSGVHVLVPIDDTGALDELFLEQVSSNLFEPSATNLSTLQKIVDGINRTRARETNILFGVHAPYFDSLGRILATPELTFASPPATPGSTGTLPRRLPVWPRDEVVERIPQQILSLLKADEPRFVVYAFGQTLKEAPSSLHFGEGIFNRMCTNYQVKSEFVTRSVVRLDGSLDSPRTVVENFNEILSE